MKSYRVARLLEPFPLDARWDQEPWLSIPDLQFNHHMGEYPSHFPEVNAKLAYDNFALYIIFRVQDRYVCARKQGYQARVCEDSCVEFFFTPGPELDKGYFNIEVNCGGTVYFHHQKGRGVNDVAISRSDFEQVRISHSLPELVQPEIASPITWVVEYRLPFTILANYAPLAVPKPGVVWRANLYKCADGSSHPHWLTWSPVELPQPDFHSPAFFGRLEFD